MYNPILDTFLAIVDTGSFSKAAARMFVSHTTVMKQMNQLEKRLRVRLFTRSKQGTVLSPAGEAFYQEAKNIIQLSAEAMERVRNYDCASPSEEDAADFLEETADFSEEVDLLEKTE